MAGRCFLFLQYTVQQMNKYARDAHTLHFLDVEQRSRMRRHLPDLRHHTELVVEPAADTIHILILDAHIEEIREFFKQEFRVDGAEVARTPLNALALLVELVADVADNLLNDVLDRHHTRRAAVLVDHNREL